MTAAVLDANSRVCAVVVARIGDTLLATPALRALRQASGNLTVLVHQQREPVLRHLDFIDELGAISKHSAWLRGRLSRQLYDAAFCWGREPALLRYCLRVARHSFAFDYPEFTGLDGATLTRVAVPPESSLHAVRERLLPVEAAGIRCHDLRLAYVVTEAERREIKDWLMQRTAGAGSLIGLQPFSFQTKAHRDWPLEHFAGLVRLICAQYPQAHILLLGDDDARKRAADLQQHAPGRLSVAAGQFPLRLSAALMQVLDLYVGVDTGPTHIAGALGIPMIALYNPRYPGRNLMPLDNPCCVMLEAPTEDMSSLSVDQVWAAVRSQLDDEGAS
jgi:heptosyltransferase-3